MPIELSPDAVDRALARLGEHDLQAPQDVEVALESIAEREDEAEPIVLSRYDLQLFLWYQLPRKFLAPLEAKEGVVAALGRFLELADPAASYAQICGSPETRRLLRAWEDEEPEAGELLKAALDASGIEPPDTEALEWGAVMGLEEARLHREVALELERALEDGRLAPSERSFVRRRTAIVVEFLRRPRPELDGRSSLHLVREERLEGWARRGSEERRALVAAVEPLLHEPASGAARLAHTDGVLEPLAWLLDTAVDGIPLTQTGALNQALVRAAVERFPGWWRSDLFGSPHREDEVFPLCQVHGLARQMRLLRRRGGKLLLSRRGEELRKDRAALVEACAPQLLADDGFPAAVQELAAAAMLSRGSLDRGEMEAEVQRAIVAEGWHADGEPPPVEDVARAASGLVALAEALGLVDYQYEFDREAGLARRDLEVRPAGREALCQALASRALGPVRAL